MTAWLPAALFSLLSFGCWGLFTKLSVMYIDSKSALIYQTLGILLVSIITFRLLNFKPEIHIKGFSFAILTGITYAIGCWFYFIAASKGKIGTVVSLTALYPLVTIFLSAFFLKEVISVKQGLGIILAFVAILLMSF